MSDKNTGGSGCDGACNRPGNVRCRGPVRRVHVFDGSRDWGTYDYCSVACAEDRRQVLTVTPQPRQKRIEAMKYRKRPIVIDAVWWDGTAKCFDDVVLPFLTDKPDPNIIITGVGYTIVSGMIHIPTLEGVMKAAPGDWIIRGIKGEFYPCKPDIFARTYEDAEPGAELEAERSARIKAEAERATMLAGHYVADAIRKAVDDLYANFRDSGNEDAADVEAARLNAMDTAIHNAAADSPLHAEPDAERSARVKAEAAPWVSH